MCRPTPLSRTRTIKGRGCILYWYLHRCAKSVIYAECAHAVREHRARGEGIRSIISYHTTHARPGPGAPGRARPRSRTGSGTHVGIESGFGDLYFYFYKAEREGATQQGVGEPSTKRARAISARHALRRPRPRRSATIGRGRVRARVPARPCPCLRRLRPCVSAQASACHRPEACQGSGCQAR